MTDLQKQITVKFEIGQKVVQVKWDEGMNCWLVANEIIEGIMVTKEGVIYSTESGYCELEESEIFTKEDALKFLETILEK